MIALSIYYYLIKYWTKKKHLLHFHVTNNELEEIMYEYYKSKMSIEVKDIDKKTTHTTFLMILSI